MSFIRYKKIGNKEYAYEIEAYWDSRLCKPRQRTKYLGVVIDPEQKVYKKKRQETKERLVVDFGDGYIVYEFLRQSGIEKLLREAYGGDISEAIKVMVAYRLCEGGAMKNIEYWQEGNVIGVMTRAERISSQKVSRLFKGIGKEGRQREFFRRYIREYFKGSEGIIIDSTALPNEIGIGITDWGYSDSEINKQMKLISVIDRDSGMPMYYRYVGGNIVDVKVLSLTIEEIRKYGIGSSVVIVDAGFFSEENLREMNGRGIDYLIRVPSGRVFYKELITGHGVDIERAKNAVRYGQRIMFIKGVEVELYGKKGYGYIVLDPERKGREIRRVMLEVIEDGIERDEEIEWKVSTRGMMVLFSSFPIEKERVVEMYYMRTKVEQLFGYSKDDLQLLPLRVHTEEGLRGYLFLMFITVVVYKLLKDALKNKYTVEEALLIMRNLKCKVYDDEILVTEPNKRQNEISSLLNIIMPKNCGI